MLKRILDDLRSVATCLLILVASNLSAADAWGKSPVSGCQWSGPPPEWVLARPLPAGPPHPDERGGPRAGRRHRWRNDGV